MSSLRDEIQPTVYSLSTEQTYPLFYMAVRLKGDQVSAGISHMQQVWNEFTSAYPFDFTFMDQQLQQRYENEERFFAMFGVFTGVAILIACMGVFGLAAYSVAKRQKEIGIRKVLGASGRGIIWLMTREYAGLVLLANLAAWPAAYWFVSSWLQDFAYHVQPGVLDFIGMSLVALAIIFLTVGYQARRAANLNPVKTLRAE